MAGKSGEIRLVFFLPVLVFALVAGIAAVFMISKNDPRKVPSGMVGKVVHPFELKAPGGIVPGLSRGDLKGQVTVVNFFASWCTPCLVEHPFLMRLAKQPGVRLVGVNYKDKTDKAVAWLKRHGNPFSRIGADLEGRTAIDWGISGVPETFVVDRQGRIRFQHIGPLTPTVIQDQLLPAIRALQRPDSAR